MSCVTLLFSRIGYKKNMDVIRMLVRIALCGLLALLLSPLAGCDVGPANIFEAAKEGNAEGVRTMLGKDPSLANTRHQENPYRQQTPLHLASTAEVVEILIGAGANVTAADGVGRTPLHLAVNAEVAQALIDGGAKVMAENPKGLTPLHLADNAGVAEVLIRKGAKVNYKKAHGEAPLYWAILDNKPDVVEVLLAKGAKTRGQLSDDRTMLHHAAHYGRTEVISVLLRHSSRIDPKDKYGATPLHHAVLQDKVAAAERLIQSGARINARLKQGVAVYGNTTSGSDADGKTPLGLARSQEMKDLLTRHRATE